MFKVFSVFLSWLQSLRSQSDNNAVPIDQPPVLPPGAFPILPPGELLMSRRASVSRIEELTGTTQAHFERYYLDTLHRCARWSQQRPSSHPRYAYPGGLLDQALETTASALKIRQAYLLPPGAVPEQAVLKKDLWTFAVFTLALLQNVQQSATEQTVTLYGDNNASRVWNPWTTAMGDVPGVIGYRVDFQERHCVDAQPAASLLLAPLLISPEGLVWIASDKEFFSAWLAGATGNKLAAGVLSEIIGKALSHFTLLTSQQELGRSRETGIEDEKNTKPLHERMLTVLRNLVDKGELSFNAIDAKGWRKGDNIWLESPFVVDTLRAKLSKEGHGHLLATNQNVIDVLHNQAVLLLSEGKAVWNITVIDDKAERTLMALGIPISRIWIEQQNLPNEFSGTVETIKQEKIEKEAPAANFVEWLRTGIADGRISYNERNSRVHVVPEGVLLVTPNLFKDFVCECGGGRWESVQQLFIKRKAHVRTLNGENIQHFIVRSGQSQAALSGLLV